MLTAEQATGFFSVKLRRIFQIIEIEAAHYTEIEAGAVIICLSSLAESLEVNAE